MTQLTMNDLVRDVGRTNRRLTDAEAQLYESELLRTARAARMQSRIGRKRQQRRGMILIGTLIIALGFGGYGGYVFGAYKEKQRQHAQAYANGMDTSLALMLRAYGGHELRLQFDDALAALHAVRPFMDPHEFADSQAMLATTFIGEIYDTSGDRSRELAEQYKHYVDTHLRGVAPSGDATRSTEQNDR